MTRSTRDAVPEGFSDEELAGWRSGRIFAAPRAPSDAARDREPPTDEVAAAADPDEPVLFVPDRLPEGRLGLVVLLHGAGSTPADVPPLMEDQYFAQGRRDGRPRIFVSHGREDRVLPIDKTSWKIVSVLRRAGYPVDFQEFTGGHEAPAEMVERALQMLQA